MSDIHPQLEAAIRKIAREEIASAMGSALADPDVAKGAKSVAGYLLGRVKKLRGR